MLAGIDGRRMVTSFYEGVIFKLMFAYLTGFEKASIDERIDLMLKLFVGNKVDVDQQHKLGVAVVLSNVPQFVDRQESLQ